MCDLCKQACLKTVNTSKYEEHASNKTFKSGTKTSILESTNLLKKKIPETLFASDFQNLLGYQLDLGSYKVVITQALQLMFFIIMDSKTFDRLKSFQSQAFNLQVVFSIPFAAFEISTTLCPSTARYPLHFRAPFPSLLMFCFYTPHQVLLLDNVISQSSGLFSPLIFFLSVAVSW